MTVWLLALALAVAAPADPPVSAEDSAADVDEEVVVWGGYAVRQARAQVVRSLEEIGWEKVRERDGRLVFRPPEPWMGRAVLYRDGRLDFRRRWVTPQSPEAAHLGPTDPEADPMPFGADIDREVYGVQGRLVGMGPASRTKLAAVHRRTLEAVRPDLDAYVETVQVTAFRTALEELPARLDDLWDRGTPLEPGAPVLATRAERRQAVLALWASRADTPEGDATARAVVVWLSEVVQVSQWPCTADELDAARTGSSRALDLP